MKLPHGCWSMAVGCALLSGTALAQMAPDARAFGQRELMLARFEQVSEDQLKVLFLRCSREASQRMLGLDEGALCSAAQDALKKRSFGGDFSALLTWWRIHRDDPIDGGSMAGDASVDASSPGR